MGVGDDLFDATQAMPGQATQELHPERLDPLWPVVMPRTSRLPPVVARKAMMTAVETMRWSLDDGGQRLLDQPPRLQKSRELAVAAQFGRSCPGSAGAQLDRAGTGLPVAVTVANALVVPLRWALARGGVAQRLGLQRHQTLRGKANHLA